MPVVPQGFDRTVDNNLLLSDGAQGALTPATGAATACQVGGAAAIRDVGAARFCGDAVFDLGAVTATAGVAGAIAVQGSTSSTFASVIVNLAVMLVGDTASIAADDDAGSGRYILAFENVKKGVTYRYIRGVVIGIGATSSVDVDLAYISKRLNAS